MTCTTCITHTIGNGQPTPSNYPQSIHSLCALYLEAKSTIDVKMATCWARMIAADPIQTNGDFKQVQCLSQQSLALDIHFARLAKQSQIEIQKILGCHRCPYSQSHHDHQCGHPTNPSQLNHPQQQQQQPENHHQSPKQAH